MANSSTKTLSELIKRMKSSEEEPLRALIDEYLLDRDSAAQRYDGHDISMVPRPRPPGRLSPSSVYGCERKSVLAFTGLRGSRTVDPDLELLFEDGHWRHHKWQFLFYDMELVLGRDRFRVISIEQFVVIPELYVAGSLDAEVAIKMSDGSWRRYVVDIKGINDRGFQWMMASDESKEENRRQLQLYMKARKKKRGILLYDNKNTNRTRTMTVDFSGSEWNDTLNWIDRVIDSIQRKRVPVTDLRCTAGSIMRDGCPYAGLCWGSTKDRTDLADMAFARSNWRGIDAAWERGLAVNLES